MTWCQQNSLRDETEGQECSASTGKWRLQRLVGSGFLSRIFVHTLYQKAVHSSIAGKMTPGIKKSHERKDSLHRCCNFVFHTYMLRWWFFISFMAIPIQANSMFWQNRGLSKNKFKGPLFPLTLCSHISQPKTPFWVLSGYTLRDRKFKYKPSWKGWMGGKKI